MTDDVFRCFISIYSNYNSKDEFCIKTSYVIFILKTDNVKRNLKQFFYVKFGLISNVIITINNNKINSISKSRDIVFLKLNLLSTIIKIKI